MKLQVATDSLVGQQTAVWIDGAKTDDVLNVQLMFSARGLNTAIMERSIEGARIEQTYYGGEAVRRLRDAAVTALARWRELEAELARREEKIPLFDSPVRLHEAFDVLAHEVNGLQQEMAQ